MSYKVPEATFQIFEPRGFSVSIPEDGNQLFAFHANLNKEFNGLEAGTWSVDIAKVDAGRFTYRNYEPIIKIGDVIYYWTYVIRDGLGFRHDNGEFRVNEYSQYPEKTQSSALPTQNANNSSPPTSTTATTTTNKVPSTTFNSGEITINSGEITLHREKEELSTCSTPSKSSVNDIMLSCAGDLIFEENFNGKSLDPGKWRMERRMPGSPDYEFNMYLDKTESLSLSNGTALIKPILFNDVYGNNAVAEGLDLEFHCTGELNTKDCQRPADAASILPPLITPQFSTINSFKFRYGRVEVRAKLPSGDWVFPQIFLNPAKCKYGKSNYSSGQIRVVQSQGNCKIRNSVILNDKEPFRSVKSCTNRCVKNEDWHLQFHNFTMVWLPESIKFLVDGDVFCIVGGGDGLYSTLADGRDLPNKEVLKALGETSMAPFDVNFYLTLGYGVGGINDFGDESRKPWRNDDENNVNKFWRNAKKYDWTHEKYQFEIDYVRVFAV